MTRTNDNGLDRDMTAAEQAAHDAWAAAVAAEAEAEQQAAADTAAARASALAKLKVLGLTDDEIAALIGG